MKRVLLRLAELVLCAIVYVLAFTFYMMRAEVTEFLYYNF